jgi:hypothetical protein
VSEEESRTYANEARSATRDAMKAVSSLIVLAALSFLFLRYAFDQWQLLTVLSVGERASLASLLATPLALIAFFMGNFWDDRVFDPLYSVDPRHNFRGRWLNTSRRNILGLFPAGTDLDTQRKAAINALQLSSAEGLYGAAKDKLMKSKQWKAVDRLLFLSKLCRSLIWPSFLVGAGLLARVAYLLIVERRLAAASLVGGGVFVLFGALLFVPYINLRVEHMVLLYRRASGLSS